ncbi:MAG: gliding motility-associated ABC transporter substrate-binding protein GldG [Bacteroidales bacterium]|nr:gliding motility-associated ABC transporter substrate-binding protein GldG [Bacteroidales bacterium]
MWSLFKKELSAFFSSITGYIVITVFLLVNGLILWVFHGDMNIPDSGFAYLDPLFNIAPWIFLFLVPAVTMRLIAEEKKSGTLEIIYTQPVSDLKIVLAKYLAALVLIVIALLPTLVYYFSIKNLGVVGQSEFSGAELAVIDGGETFGAYLGLFFLAAVYAAIGVWASSLTENQIIAFLLAIGLCLFMYLGFDALGSMGGKFGLLLSNLGIDAHYKSISRGVIDSRDIIYFVSVSAVFVLLSKLRLETGKRRNIKTFLTALAVIVVANLFSSYMFVRADLTGDKKYSLTDFTKQYLRNLKGNVMIRVYLDGNQLPVSFKRMRSEIKDRLDEFRIYGGNKIAYTFINPTENEDKQVRYGIYKQLYDMGLRPVEIDDISQDKETKTMIFPCAIVCYTLEAYTGNEGEARDTTIVREIGINLLNQDPQLEPGDEQNIFNSMETFEYEIINTIYRLSQIEKPQVAFIEGHGEAEEDRVMDICTELSNYYDVRRGPINGRPGILDQFAAVVIAKPTKPFSEDDKFVIDQYIMNGGSVLWLVDATSADLDSLYNAPASAAMPLDLNLDDMLFTYGARLNPDLIKDMQCAPVGLAVPGPNNQPQIKLFPWDYFPVILSREKNPITKHLNYTLCRFAGTIDTVGSNTDITKTVLLSSSQYSKNVPVPVSISFDGINTRHSTDEYNRPFQNIAVLMEGSFESLYKDRPTRTVGGAQMQVKPKSDHAKMIVVADGDIALNDISPKGEAYPLGFDRNSQNTFKGNKEFIVNALNYLTGDGDLLTIRMKEVKVRVLDKERAIKERSFYGFINVALPLLILALTGLAVYFVRKRKYSTKK